MSEDLDRGVGLLLEKIKSLGIGGNTYVIYMSDNGSSTRKSLRGGKGGVWEGGIRVPLIIRGPGVAANSWCHERVVGYDFYPTFCKLAGVTQPLLAASEGGLITHLLKGESGAVKRPRPELVFHFPHYQGDTPHTALFLGDLKLMRFYEDNSVMLFDVKSDVTESKDLVAEMPDEVKKMTALMDLYLKDVDAAMPVPNPNFDPNNPPSMDKAKGGGSDKKGER